MSEDPDHAGVAGKLVASLTKQARYVDDGQFTLDPKSAREKLRTYQLVDPLAYLLLVVEAAAIARASSVELSCGPTSVAEFVGVSLSSAQVEHVFHAVFIDTDDLRGDALAAARIQQLFGVAANAALSLAPTRIEIENIDASARLHRLTARPDGTATFETLAGNGPAGRTRFVVHEVRDRSSPAKQVALIRDRCRYASFPINLYGQPMSQGLRRAVFGLRTDRVCLDDGTAIGLAAFDPAGAPAKLLLVTRGVWSETITLAQARPGFVAIVDVDLRKDLSQHAVLRGPEFDEVMRAVLRAQQFSLSRPS